MPKAWGKSSRGGKINSKVVIKRKEDKRQLRRIKRKRKVIQSSNERIIKAQYSQPTFSQQRQKRVSIRRDKDGDYNVYVDGQLQKDAFYSKEEAEDYGDYILSDKLHDEKEERQVIEKKGEYYRYSIAYYSKYDKTFRCEIYTTEPKNEQSVFLQLDNYLKLRITQNTRSNNGRQKIYNSLRFIGFESERVGSNDIGHSKLNHMTFWVD